MSTALAKAEHETRIKEEEAMEVVKKWEHSGESPDLTKLGRLILTQNEVKNNNLITGDFKKILALVILLLFL